MTSARPDGLPAWARVTPARRAHIERVIALLEAWATALHVPADEAARWRRAGWLHDALKDAPRDQLAPGDDPEFADAHPSLWHGPAAARRAAAAGETDAGVLAATRYHTVGSRDWDDAGRMLFLADYLEPGRPLDPARHTAWVARVAEGPDGVADVVREVLAVRIARRRRDDSSLHPRTVAWARALGL